ncbi:MAG: hypothetical protein Tsb0021_09880 [Chlamydiales bacterium]
MSNLYLPAFEQALLNTVKITSIVFAGAATAYLVNKAAHKIFKCEEGGYTSKGIKFVSFVAGTAAGIYTASFCPIAVFSWSASWHVLKFTLPLTGINFALMKVAGASKINIVPPLIFETGVLVGNSAPLSLLTAVFIPPYFGATR